MLEIRQSKLTHTHACSNLIKTVYFRYAILIEWPQLNYYTFNCEPSEKTEFKRN